MSIMVTNHPFTPVVYEHAAKLIGRSPWEVSRSAVLLAEAHFAACRRYGLRAVVLGIDLYNLEPEVYGAEIRDAGPTAVPVVGTHPLDTADGLEKLPLPAWSEAGRIPLLLEAGRRILEVLPGLDVAIPVNGPFSLACNLAGFETVLLALLDDPEELRRGLEHLCIGQMALVETLAGHGFRPVLFESAATPPLVPPECFADLVVPSLAAIVACAQRTTGAPPPCIIGGDTLTILSALIRTGTGAIICPAETDQTSFMTALVDHPGLGVRVNMPPDVFLGSDPGPADLARSRAGELAARHPRGSVGSGILPYDANPDIVVSLIQGG